MSVVPVSGLVERGWIFWHSDGMTFHPDEGEQWGIEADMTIPSNRWAARVKATAEIWRRTK